MAIDYDATIPNFCPGYQEALVEFSERCKDATSIFEIGIGTGNIARAVLTVNPTAKYAGVDVNQESLEKAKEKLKQYDCHLAQADFSTIDFPSVDVIVSSLSIHHLTKEGQATLFGKIYNAGKKFLHFE